MEKDREVVKSDCNKNTRKTKNQRMTYLATIAKREIMCEKSGIWCPQPRQATRGEKDKETAGHSIAKSWSEHALAGGGLFKTSLSYVSAMTICHVNRSSWSLIARSTSNNTWLGHIYKRRSVAARITLSVCYNHISRQVRSHLIRCWQISFKSPSSMAFSLPQSPRQNRDDR